MEMKMTNWPHFWWIICIMSLTIIALISYILIGRIENGDKLMEFIAVSATILSITLSIFAIQYTYTSNVQIQQQFEKINSVADDIRSTSSKLNHACGKLNDNIDQILNSLKNIDQHQQEMSSQIKNIKNQPITEKISELNISNKGQS